MTTYTTRIDTVYGVSFLALAPEHPLVTSITTPAQSKAVTEYVDKQQQKQIYKEQTLQKTNHEFEVDHTQFIHFLEKRYQSG